MTEISANQIHNLKLLWQRESTLRQSAQQAEAPRFNLFRLLRRQEDELSHSALIGTLLEQSGNHAQGEVFLRSFLDLLARKSPSLRDLPDNPLDIWSVVREKSTAWGRLDIVLSSERAGVLIAIENKINAGEGFDQIDRYRSWLDGRRDFSRCLLVYLTLEGDKSKSGEEDVRLSYRENIRAWLEGILAKGEVSAPRIRDAITQYLQALPLENSSIMNEPDSFTLQLADPQYVETALAVGDRLVEVKTLLLKRFYSAVQDRIEESLGKAFTACYEFEINDYSDAWAAVSILFRERNERRNYAYWRMEKCARVGDGKILFGIATNLRSKGLDGKEFRRLVEVMEQHGFDKTNPWWVRRKFTEHDLESSAFWVSIAATNDVAHDLADQMVQLFRDTRSAVERLNKDAIQ